MVLSIIKILFIFAILIFWFQGRRWKSFSLIFRSCHKVQSGRKTIEKIFNFQGFNENSDNLSFPSICFEEKKILLLLYMENCLGTRKIFFIAIQITMKFFSFFLSDTKAYATTFLIK